MPIYCLGGGNTFTQTNESKMKKYIIERMVPGAGKMTAEELKDISKTSAAVISILGRPYRWIKTYISEDKIYCVHEAENEEDIREHSKCSNLPISSIVEIKAEINTSTAL